MVFTDTIVEKLRSKRMPVDPWEVEDAFNQWEGRSVIDKREKNRTSSPTIWFVSETSDGRMLKVAGIFRLDKKQFAVKTAYDPEPWEIEYYENHKR